MSKVENDPAKPKLRPANDNDWYCLATLYGEQPAGDMDSELAVRNQQAWGIWSSDPFETRNHIREDFKTRTGGRDFPVQHGQTIRVDFSCTHFDRPVSFRGFHFRTDTDFGSAEFAKSVDFSSVIFEGKADFRAATFADTANFNSATFSLVTNFNKVRFEDAQFSPAFFKDHVSFDHAYFCSAKFDSALFHTSVDFSSATFCGVASFQNKEFKGRTNFANAKFKKQVPDFRGRTMHEATEWHGVEWPKPPQLEEDARRQVYAYERLKQEMEQRKKHGAEQFFFRQELRAARRLHNTFSERYFLNMIYKALSDYGDSVMLPLAWIAVSTAIGFLIFQGAPVYNGGHLSRADALIISISNVLSFLPITRGMTNVQFTDLETWAKLFGVGQSVFGVILFFLLGLALRNRFRMK